MTNADHAVPRPTSSVATAGDFSLDLGIFAFVWVSGDFFAKYALIWVYLTIDTFTIYLLRALICIKLILSLIVKIMHSYFLFCLNFILILNRISDINN